MVRKKVIKNKETNEKKRDYTAVLLEDMMDKITLVSEGHSSLRRDIGNLSKDLNGKFEILNSDVGSFRKEFGGFRKEMYEFRDKTEANLDAIQKFLSRIDDEYTTLRHKVNILEIGKITLRDFDWIKDKVLDLEKKIKECQKQQASFAAKA